MTVDHAELIRSMPVPFMAYEATAPYRILDENAAHETVALTKKVDIVGKPFLEAFPDTSDDFKRTGKSAPIESIKRIKKTKQPDSLGEFKWDVPLKDGTFATKYWRSTQYPIFDDSGDVTAVYQLTEDITEQKTAQKQLELTKYQLDQTLADGLVGTWLWDIKGAKVFGGPNLASMFGVSADAAAKGLELDSFVSGIHPDDRARVSKQIERTVKTRTAFESEYRTIDRTGKVRWLIARGRVESDENGELERFPGVVVDITERKQAEAALEESEARLRFMADSMPQLVWITRPDGYHEYYNQRWYDYTGTKPGSTDGAGWNGLFYPGDQKRAFKLWNHSLKTGDPYEIEYRLYHAESKSYRWVIGRAMPLRNNDGEITKWYGTCTDVHDQKHISEQQTFLSDVSKELVASLDTRKLLAKLTKLSVPIISDWCTVDLYSPERGFEQVSVAHVDPKKISLATEYRRHNPLDIDDDTAIPRILKTGKAELYPVITNGMLEAYIDDEKTLRFMKSLELSSIMIVPLKQGKKTIGAISFVSAGSGRHFSENDFQMAGELASRVSLSITNAELYNKSVNEVSQRRELEHQLRTEKQKLESRVKERTTQLQLTNQGLRDEILRRQSAEKELSEYSDELTRSNKELEDFAYVASHDLQEPLRKIQAFGNLLLGEYGDELGIEGADYLKRMHSAANRMSTLIQDLLTFSRVTRKERGRQEVDLNDVLADVMSDLETRVNETGAKIKVGNLPTVSSDPTHMRQLFQNLIGNAIKFHRTDVTPSVEVKARAKKGGSEITITDNGIGFDEKYLDRIFSVFQRLHERSSYEGTGIGLAVCRKIVERYDGTITAVSTKGKGSTFIVWLPVKKGKQ